ncbi:hypothetical protein PV08_09284 [Exophiala spinifera]|uniref:Uncharacterized protein n=1 Tax=Exophiala spinifera TaxID=91928 RepID=A0A0D2B024_9EURO|nr:uncharacterized protein PV08_09284 [Exophiala spinifera]KIW12010.1 hypothetical protein PV08_09284 [Exophiala spinifera]
MLDPVTPLLDEEGTRTPPHTEQPDLSYPEIYLRMSLESLLAHSHLTSSTVQTMPASDLPSSSLDDSWASLKDIDSSNDDDLRSEDTDVGSLLDVHSSDDVHSVVEGLDMSDGESTDEGNIGDTSTEDLGCTSTLKTSTAILSVQQEPTLDSSQTHGFGPVQDEAETDSAHEPPTWIYTTTRPMMQDDARKVDEKLRDGHETTEYNSVTSMTLRNDNLDLNTLDYFKVVLLGTHVDQFQPEIQRKLGDALVSQRLTGEAKRTSTSRYHLVPNSFGPGAEPDFADLVAIDKQIDFDCYDVIEEDGSLGPDSRLRLRNSHTNSEVESRWVGRTHMVVTPRWIPPDLAVICVELDERQRMDGNSHAFLKFAARHNIASIVIRMDRGWFGQYSDSIWRSDWLFETIEPVGPGTKLKGKVLMKQPVSMASFLNLDSAALNKHIAFVTSTASEFIQSAPFTGSEFPEEMPNKSREVPASFLVRYAPMMKSAFMVLWVVSIYVFLGAQLLPTIYDALSGSSGDTVKDMAELLNMTHTCTSEIAASTSDAALHDSASVMAVRDVNLATISSGLASSMTADAVQFQVGIAGENQLVVRLPKVATSRKRRSSLSVVLERDNEPIRAAVHEIFDGVYIVQLHPRDAYGDVKVHLAMSKPDLSETLTISFGDRSALSLLYLKNMLKKFESHWEKQSGALFGDIAQHIQPVEGQVLSMLQGMAEKGSLQGKRAVKLLAESLSSTRATMSSLLATLPTDALKPQFGKAMVVHKLAAAQKRARQIVANAKHQVHA